MESDLSVSDGPPPGDASPGPARLTGTRPARRKGLPQEVADQLLDLIATSGSQEVALPSERQLCDDFAVGRNALREALAALDHMGVVETRGKQRIGLTPRARALVLARASTAAPVRELLLDPMEVRRILEPESAALAAKRASEQSLREIERTTELMDEGIRRNQSVVEYDSAFHVAIARATANQMLIELVGALNETLRPSREVSFRPTEASVAALDDHRAILSAIRAGDARAARKAMRSHLDHVEQLIRATVSERASR
jgi:GntR family transcriptional repressor for pyruvate dehydrogenase complex